jgi:hypothetical protein
VREYETGATRSELGNKIQYEGYISPLVWHRFGQYMRRHQTREDGNFRAADNWQKGMPVEDYMDSLLRHVMDVWLLHRGYYEASAAADIEDALCGVLFNTQGYLHCLLRGQYEP